MQRPYKTPEEYSKSIKILKYYTQETLKENERLKIQLRLFERDKAKKKNSKESNVASFKADVIIKNIYKILKKKGIALQAIFRMTDSEYKGEISNQNLIRTLGKLKVELNEKQLTQLINAIDTSANGKVSVDQFQQFVHTYGVGDNSSATIKLQAEACRKFSSHLRSYNRSSAESLFTQIDKDGSQIIDTAELRQYCKSNSVSLNDNQLFSVMRYMDPGKQGIITKQKFVKAILTINKNQDVNNSNQQFERQMKVFKAKLVKNNVNPYELFDEADLDETGFTTEQQLQKVMKNHFPRETPFTLKKWIDLINYNKDKVIQRNQFLNIITHFYTPIELQQLNKLSKNKLNVKIGAESTNKLLQQFSDKIEDMQKTKKQVFQILDINGDKTISSQQLKEGLKKQFSLQSPFVISLLKVFDKDNSGSISMNQFLEILGEDVQFSEVEIADQIIPKKKNTQSKTLKNKPTMNNQEKLKQKEETKKDTKTSASLQKKVNKKQIKETKNQQIKPSQKNEKQITKKLSIKHDSIEKKSSLPQKQKHQQLLKKQQIVKEQKSSKINTDTTKKSLQKTISKKQSKNQQKLIESKIENKKQSKLQEKQIKTDKKQEIKVVKPAQQTKILNSKKQKKQVQETDKQQKAKEKKPKQEPKLKREPQPQPQPQIEVQYQPEPQYQPEKQYQQQDFHAQTPEINDQKLEPHLKRLSGLYKINEQKLISQFGKYDKKNGYITEQGFKKALDVVLKIKDPKQKQQIFEMLFQKANVQQTIVWYSDWLKEISQEYQPILITDKQWKVKQEKPIEQHPLKKVQKIEIVQPKFDPDIEPQVGPKIDDAIMLIIDSNKSIKKDISERKSSIKDQSEPSSVSVSKPDKRGTTLQNVFISNEIVGLILNGPVDGRSAKLLPFIQYDKSQVDKFYKTAETVKTKKTKYKDPNFGHNINFLTKNSKKNSVYSQYSWTHVNDIWKTPLAFKNEVGPQDIRQGQLGDCYFLSSLACLAQYNELIQRLFEYEDENNSFFGIWLCIDGTWTLVQLDGWIVTQIRQKKPEPVFSRSGQDQQFWVLLLQKAYAKAYGSYDQICSGHPIQAIRDLTGAPGKIYNHIQTAFPIDKLWKILVQADRNQFMMTAGTDPRRQGMVKSGKQEKVTMENIVLGHAYSILNLAQLNTGQRIIQMRNPWGGTQWNGAWGDKDKRWTPELKQKLNFKDEDDGIFWMPYEVYYKQFQATCINFIRPTYYYKSQNYSKKDTQFLIVLDHFSHGYITISQKDKRHQTSSNDSKYQIVSFQGVASAPNKPFREVKGDCPGLMRDTCIQYNLQKDEKLYVLVNLQSLIWCNISYYGKQNVNFSVQPIDKMLDEILLNIKIEDEQEGNDGKCSIITSYFSCYFFFRVKNITKKNISEVNNLKILPPIKDPLKWQIKLQAGETKLVKYKIVDTSKESGMGGCSMLSKYI